MKPEFARVFYLTATASDIGAHDMAVFPPASLSGETSLSGSGTSSADALIYKFATGALGLTSLAAGTWTFKFYAAVSSSSDVTQITAKVYKLASDGTKTLIFTETSVELNNVSPGLVTITHVEGGATSIDPTDRLTVEVYQATNSGTSKTTTLYLEGATRQSRVILPFDVPIGNGDMFREVYDPYGKGVLSGSNTNGPGTTGGGSDYLLLDASNDPIKGPLDIDITNAHALRVQAVSFTTGSQISSGSIDVTDYLGSTISGLTIGDWYVVETYNGPWCPGVGYNADFYTVVLSLDNNVWSSPVGMGGTGGVSPNPVITTAIMHSGVPYWAQFLEVVNTNYVKIYFQAVTTEVYINVGDVSYRDNTGTMGWKLYGASVSIGEKFNVDTTTGLTTIDHLVSTVATGTAPLAVTSTTVNTNLNADMLDGLHADEIGGVTLPDPPDPTVYYDGSGHFSTPGVGIGAAAEGFVGTQLFRQVLASNDSPLDIASIPAGYDYLEIFLTGQAGVGGNINVVCNNDTGANYVTAYHYFGASSNQNTSAGSSGVAFGPSNVSTARISIHGYDSLDFPKIMIGIGEESYSGSFTDVWSTKWDSLDPITRLTISPVSGLFMQGTICLVVGYKKQTIAATATARVVTSDPKDATPGNRPAGSVAELAFYAGKMYFCTNSTTPTWEMITSS